MALDGIQRKTRTMLPTSLGTKGSQKSSFLEVFSTKTKPNDPTSSVITHPVNSRFFDDTLHEKKLPPNSSSPLIMTNKHVITKLYNLQLKAHRQEREECYRLQRTFGTIKRPTETQYDSLVSKPVLYQKRWDITIETIRVQKEAYVASPLADSTSPLQVPIYQKSFFHPYSTNKAKYRTHARNVEITCLSLSSFLAAYKAQV